MKQYEVLGHCPICNKRLLVTQLTCQGCKTQINGQYTLNEFCYLDKELLNFAIVFIKNRGNIKEVERELGISYPTVRRMLDQTIQGLGFTTGQETIDKQDSLSQLERGDITVEEATECLKR